MSSSGLPSTRYGTGESPGMGHRATKYLEHLSQEEVLGAPWGFRLQRRSFWGWSINTWGQEWSQVQALLSGGLLQAQKKREQKRKQEIPLNLNKILAYHEDDQTVNKMWSLQPWRYSKVDRTWLWTTCCRRSWPVQRSGAVPPQPPQGSLILCKWCLRC